MVKTKNYWPLQTDTTGQTLNFNCMSPALEPGLGLPTGIDPGSITFPSNVELPKFGIQGIPHLTVQDGNQNRWLPQNLYSPFQTLCPAANQCSKEKLSFFSSEKPARVAPDAAPECQRRFLIFDQSGSGTRLLYNLSFPPIAKPNMAAMKGFEDCFVSFEEDAFKRDQTNQTKLTMHEGLDENHLSEEESVMHEDTEEIDALLYSDDDDDSKDDSYDDEDDLKSTGHSPFLITDGHGKQENRGKLMDEVCNSEVPNKRLKLLDGRYKSPTLRDTASSAKVDERNWYGASTESNLAKGQVLDEEMVSAFGNDQTKKEKLRVTLNILETIIPGAKDSHRDPLSVLDSAIDYLELLKLQAKSLGVNYY